MTIDDLISIVPPPAAPVANGADDDWAEIERELGFGLPSDYKSIINTYGLGNFGMEAFSYLWILNPFSSDKYLNLDYMKWLITDYEHCKLKWPGDHPFDAGVGENGLFPWGKSDNGDTFYWLTNGSPDEWTIVVYDDDSVGFEQYDAPLLTFLCEWISGRYESEILIDFTADNIVFKSYDGSVLG
jgi:hypothetical protein